MKRVIALLLAVMMLPIFTVVTQAAGTISTMDQGQFKDVLLGNQDGSTNFEPDLIRAYRNVSIDQLDVFQRYYDNVPLSVVSAVESGDTSVISTDEAKILAYGFIKLMTFPKQKNTLSATVVTDVATEDNRINSVDPGNDIDDRAVQSFYNTITIGTATTTPMVVLNKLTKDSPVDQNGYMSKYALGAFVRYIQKSLRRQAADPANLNAFINAFIADSSNFLPLIKPFITTAMKEAFDNADDPSFDHDHLAAARDAMFGNGFLVETAPGNKIVDADRSPFIQLILSVFDAMHADPESYVNKNGVNFTGKDVLYTVFNTIISGVIDAKVQKYSDSTGLSPQLPLVEPNNLVATLQVGQTIYLKVIPDNLDRVTNDSEAELTFNLAASMNAGVVDANDNIVPYATVDMVNNMIQLTGVSAGAAILKLYRDTDPGDFIGNMNGNTKELFMELDIVVNATTPPAGGGGGTPRVQAPTISYEVTEDGRIIVTLETTTSGATIYYTTDGSAPDKNSQKYEGPFEVADETTIKAYAIKSGWLDSYVTTDTIDLESGKIPTLTGEHIAYVHGRDTGNFDAEDYVTRGEVSAIFSRLIVKKMVFNDNSASKFSDVNNEDWYASYVKYLSNVDIIKGYEDGTFKPNAPITRAEFATVASRFFEIESGAENQFTDVDDSHWAKEYIDSAVVKGWLLGYEDGTFRPDQPIKRSETVTIVNRMLNRVADKDYIEANYDDVLTYPDLDESHWAYYEILEASNWHDHKIENNKEFWTDIFYLERFTAS